MFFEDEHLTAKAREMRRKTLWGMAGAGYSALRGVLKCIPRYIYSLLIMVSVLAGLCMAF